MAYWVWQTRPAANIPNILAIPFLPSRSFSKVCITWILCCYWRGRDASRRYSDDDLFGGHFIRSLFPPLPLVLCWSRLPQLTGALSHVLPIMITVTISKTVADALSSQDGGIYAVWIAMRSYTWLPPVSYKDKKSGQTGEVLMRPVTRLVTVEDGVCSLRALGIYLFLLFEFV